MNQNDDQDRTTEINFYELRALHSWLDTPAGTLALTPELVLEWISGGHETFQERLRITIKKVTE